MYIRYMARLNIDTGAVGNPATGDTLRTAMTKINTNFEEVYQLVGDADTGTITTSITNGDLKLQANGTGIIEIDQLQINNAAITPIATNSDLTLSANGTGAIQLGSATIARTGDLTVDTSGDIILDAGGGDVFFKDDGTIYGILANTSGNLEIRSGTTAAMSMSGANVTAHGNFTLTSGTPFLQIQRTDNANVPGIDFLGSAGTAGSKILFDGTSGTANELIFQTFTVSGGLAEAFRVQGGGAKVTGTLDIDGGISITDNKITSSASNANIQIDASGSGAIELLTQKVIMANLPTSDPSVAGQLFRDGTDLKVSVG